MEKKVNEIYKEAYSDISEKWDKFMDSHYPKLDKAIKGLEEAKKSGDKAAIKEAQDLYERTARNIVVNNRRFTAMANETAERISHTNEVALSYVNDQLPEIYTTNYNAFAGEKIKGYSFSLVNEATVKELALDDKTLLPKKKLDIPKDIAWNKKLINSQMIQGILQGENIPKIAKRLQNVTNMNRVSAIRNARTMTTAAENKGRQDSFKKATNDGVVMARRWIATHDERTRTWHSDLDGVEVGVDEPWENDYGEISFPGDPTADPANVYNCRCAMRAVVKGFNWSKEETDEEESIDNTQVEHEIVEGKDISATWERRPDQFDFEIEDVINAQGFDGLPKVVDAEEFGRYVQESNFIAQRTYSAPDQETLDAYRDQLYNGKWYVDCSTGGAAFGQGMYGFYANDVSINDDIKRGIEYYSSKYSGKKVAIETFTLDKNAKLISYNEISKIAENIPDKESIWGTMDEGVAATLKGYDGIIAKNNEIIILNRTKVIFKGE